MTIFPRRPPIWTFPGSSLHEADPGPAKLLSPQGDDGYGMRPSLVGNQPLVPRREPASEAPPPRRTRQGRGYLDDLEPGFGQLAVAGESGGRADAISTGEGDHGGQSYGLYQFASRGNELPTFLERTGYDHFFRGMQRNTPEFRAQWRYLSENDPGFIQAQTDYVLEEYYAGTMRRLERAGIDLSDRGRAVRELVLSTALQYGWDRRVGIFSNALEGRDLSSLTDEQIIDLVQDEKEARFERDFANSRPNWEGLRRRVKQDRVRALEMDHVEAVRGQLGR